MLQTSRKVLRIAGLATAALTMTVVGTAAANRGADTEPPAQQHTSHTVTFTETDIGAPISQQGSTSVDVISSTNSLDGNGAQVEHETINGKTGTDTVTHYQANGVSRSTDTFTFATPDANGIVSFSGHGKCTGGTGVHKHEKCNYTLGGTQDTQTNVFTLQISGTDTR